jgi:predicted O-methyltransferase YrrM
MLLNANVALGFLVKRGPRYSNSPVAKAYLVKGRKGYLGDTVLHMSRALSPRWARLAEAVKRDLPVHRLPRPLRQEETAKDFTLAMHGMAAFLGHLLASRLDLGHYHKLLDIGGGSGAISAELAERLPKLRAVVLERPKVCRVARELWRSSPAAGRLRARAQSYLQPLPRGCDVALLSQVLHAESEWKCRRLLKRVYDALETPGLVIVIEFALNEERTGPRFPALFSLNMLINTDEGAAYSREEILRWLRDAGFQKPRAKPLPGDRTLFTAQKL